MKQTCEKRPEAPVAHYQEHVFNALDGLNTSEVAVRNRAVVAIQGMLGEDDGDWYGRVDALSACLESIAMLSMKMRIPLSDVMSYSLDRISQEEDADE